MHIEEQEGKQIPNDLIQALNELPSKFQQILNQSEQIRNLAANFTEAKGFLYLGRGMNFPVALEGALKLKEISYIHAEGCPAAEMKHGPLALIDSTMPSVFIAPDDNTYEKVASNMEEVKARKGTIIAITNDNNPPADYYINVPKTHELLAPILNNIPLQLLAYHIADLKNLDVDKPRNLAKSVTVE